MALSPKSLRSGESDDPTLLQLEGVFKVTFIARKGTKSRQMSVHLGQIPGKETWGRRKLVLQAQQTQTAASPAEVRWMAF
jgi:hypothetical protein